ncbi:unnamed protein product, partial [Vicia faba]
ITLYVSKLKSVGRDFPLEKLVTLRETQRLCRLSDELAENLVCAISKDIDSVVSIEAKNDEEKIVDGQGLRIRVDCDGYSTASSIDSNAMWQCSRESLENEQFEKVSVALNEFEYDEMKLDRTDEIRVEFIETDDVMQRKLEVVNNTETSDMVEETSNAGRLLEFNAEGFIDSMMLEQNTSVDCLGEHNPRTCESLLDAFAAESDLELKPCSSSPPPPKPA